MIGGPHGDAGLTGRKIIVDTYGGMARHGGGAFSGKDPSKVDRSAAYADALGRQEHRRGQAGPPLRGADRLRHRRGAPGLRSWCRPSAPACCPTTQLEKIVDEVFDLTPKGIIDALKLKRPIYSQTAAYGHFGRRPFSGVYQDDGKHQKVDFFTWEQTDRVKDLLSAAR